MASMRPRVLEAKGDCLFNAYRNHVQAIEIDKQSSQVTELQKIVLVRHGQGFHNVDENYSILDPGLTEKGHMQAKSLRGYPDLVGAELIVVSPRPEPSKPHRISGAKFLMHP